MGVSSEQKSLRKCEWVSPVQGASHMTYLLSPKIITYAIFFKVVKSWDRVIRSNDKSVRKTEVASDEFDCCSFRTKCQHSWQQMWYRDSNLAKQRWSFKSTYATGRLWITGSKIVCVLVCGISKVWLSKSKDRIFKRDRAHIPGLCQSM